MAGNVFALCMIVMFLATVAVLKLAGARPTLRASLIGVLFALVAFQSLDVLTPVHLCFRGGTAKPELLGAVLAGAVLATVARRKIKIPVIVALLTAGYGLSFWAIDLVHETPYVGNSRYPEVLEHISTNRLQQVRERLRALSIDNPDLVLLEGWIDDALMEVIGERSGADYGARLGTIGYFWHTPFTGIYRLEELRTGVWCPGGHIAECAAKLQVKYRD